MHEGENKNVKGEIKGLRWNKKAQEQRKKIKG